MRRMLHFAALLSLVGCVGTLYNPLTSRPFSSDPKISGKPDVREILPREEFHAVGDTFRLSAVLSAPDTALPRFWWESDKPNVLRVWAHESMAVFNRPGKAEVCVRVWYFYVPEARWVLIVRNGSSTPFCKTYFSG